MWESNIHERTKFLLWKLANHRPSVLSDLAAKGVELESIRCAHSFQSCENEVHVFFHCEVAKRLWFVYPWGIRWENTGCNDLSSFLNCLIDPVGILQVYLKDTKNFFLFNVITLDHLWWI